MTTATHSSSPTLHAIEVVKDETIVAPLDIVWETLLEQLGPASELEDGAPMPMILEARPGGRWFRDLPNDTGHLWGHVQVIKPPKLLEICGPLFMSYPSINHLQYRLTPQADQVTHLRLVHKAIGPIPDDHRAGVNEGWRVRLARVRQAAERRAVL